MVGRDATSLRQKWAQQLATYHGVHSHSFPNCYFIGFTQTGYTANVPHTLNEQAKHIAYVIKHGVVNNVATMEATQAAEDAWVEEILRLSRIGEKFYAECTPGYYNNEGKGNNGNGFLAGQYGGGPVAFFKILEDWRADGQLQGLKIT